MDTKSIIHILTSNGVTMEKGLNMQEIKMIENLYEIHFPPDFVGLLSDVLPTSDKFINWLDFSKDNVERIKGKLNWPIKGLIFDIDNNDFWYAGWGNKPENIKDAIEICKNEIKKHRSLFPYTRTDTYLQNLGKKGIRYSPYIKPILYIMGKICYRISRWNLQLGNTRTYPLIR